MPASRRRLAPHADLIQAPLVSKAPRRLSVAPLPRKRVAQQQAAGHAARQARGQAVCQIDRARVPHSDEGGARHAQLQRLWGRRQGVAARTAVSSQAHGAACCMCAHASSLEGRRHDHVASHLERCQRQRAPVVLCHAQARHLVRATPVLLLKVPLGTIVMARRHHLLSPQVAPRAGDKCNAATKASKQADMHSAARPHLNIGALRGTSMVCIAEDCRQNTLEPCVVRVLGAKRGHSDPRACRSRNMPGAVEAAALLVPQRSARAAGPGWPTPPLGARLWHLEADDKATHPLAVRWEVARADGQVAAAAICEHPLAVSVPRDAVHVVGLKRHRLRAAVGWGWRVTSRVGMGAGVLAAWICCKMVLTDGHWAATGRMQTCAVA